MGVWEERAGHWEPAHDIITNHKVINGNYLLTAACKSLYFLITS